MVADNHETLIMISIVRINFKSKNTTLINRGTNNNVAINNENNVHNTKS